MFHYRTMVLLLLGLSWPMLSTPDAHAQACKQWSAAGLYRVHQQNGFTVDLRDMRQSGKHFYGSASYSGGAGQVEGTIDAERFGFLAKWNNGSVGVYTGFMTNNGIVADGRTYDRSNPGSQSEFTTNKLQCAAR